MDRNKLLPKGAPNPLVWCERCGYIHRYHTFTQDDFDAIIEAAAKDLADAIDSRIEEEIFNGNFLESPRDDLR